jgi:hypothetical protein
MRLTFLTIRNFKALENVTVPLSSFVCIIGENNAGKSSVMLALLKFIEGGKLDRTYFFNAGQEISIAVRLEDISDSDLALIPNSEHRSRFEAILTNRSITLVRRFAVDVTSRLRCVKRVPNDSRFDADSVDRLLGGKRPGPAFSDELEQAFSELKGKVDSKTNQTKARELIRELEDSIPDTEKRDQESDLPSGIDNSVRPILPDPIYIPGVKDLADDIKTKDSSNFGKLLGILLTAITPQLAETEAAFGFLRKALNRVVDEAGNLKDERLDAVKDIETTVERFVQESFPKVRLDVQIPPPEIKTILSSAEVWADDGVNGPITTKGDGLKRAMTFAILRAYVELKNRPAEESGSRPAGSYLFLFEEPELFLHPVAQRALFDALGEISHNNHVIVTTHSPLFFQPSSTKTFVKMLKRSNATRGAPYADALAIDISGLDARTQFQLITFETSNAAFFCKSVVLVEGDSDYIVLPHLARLLNPEWNAETVGLAFCRVSGKGNVGRYRRFFDEFEIQLSVIADLDCVVDGFEHLDATMPCQVVRERLMQQVDAYIASNHVAGKLSARDLRDLQCSNNRRTQFEAIRETYSRCLTGNATQAELEAVGRAFFEDEALKKRRAVLQMDNLPEILSSKRELLRLLREEGICLLEKGEIEAYYPREVTGQDKPSRALDFCEKIDTRDKALALCDSIPVPFEPARPEFELIFERVFGNPVATTAANG